jgi:cell division protein FtsX
MHDLDTRLERLAVAATRDAVPPEPAAIAGRGRRRRRRQLAGSVLVVAAVVAAGVVLPSRLAGRSGDDAVTATAPPTDVRGAAMLVGYWFGKTDASVFLDEHVTPAQRDAVLRRLQSLDVVDAVYFESHEDALARLRVLYRNKPSLADVDPSALPASFRVRLDAPDQVARLQRALCPRDARCMEGVATVLDDRVPVKALLIAKLWAASSDATVYLPAGATGAERKAVRARLAAVDGVARVTHESPEAAYRRLPAKLRRDARDPAKVTPPFSPAMMPAAFHVALDRPARVEEFHRALCGSRRTGACPGGLVVLEHPRR